MYKLNAYHILQKLKFEIHITDHCNLNCIGCNHFSPLADNFYLELTDYERDCKRLYELTNGEIEEIVLLGGEPLLHPNLQNIFYITSQYFQTAKIILLTNGILLASQEDDFWESCHKYGIHILITKYPIYINYETIIEKANRFNVKCSYGINRNSEIKKMECIPINPNNQMSAESCFNQCYKANNCITLRNGKLYTCCTIPFAPYLKKHFNLPIDISPNNGIDIYKTNNIEEILTFLSKPVAFCKYCDFEHRREDIPWGISKKELDEWT